MRTRPKWYDFSHYALTPALGEINDINTDTVTATPQKVGRFVNFDWK